MKRVRATQDGFSIMEVLVAMVILAISFLALAESNILAYKMDRHAKVKALMREVAMNSIESYASRQANSIAAENSSILREPISGLFLQIDTTVTVNADGSRSISITVSDTSDRAPSPVTLEELVYP